MNGSPPIPLSSLRSLEALLEVTILMEKSKKEGKIGKPLPRELLSIPSFLRSQLQKHKV